MLVENLLFQNNAYIRGAAQKSAAGAQGFSASGMREDLERMREANVK